MTQTSPWRRTATTSDAFPGDEDYDGNWDPSRGGPALFSSGLRFESHFFWHPKPNTAADKTKPYHEVGLFGAVEFRH